MKKSRIASPDLPRALSSGALERFESSGEYSLFSLADRDLSGQTASAPMLDALVLERINLSSSALRRPHIRDSRLTKCDLSNADWSYAAVERVEFLDGRLTGFKSVESSFRDVRFVSCKADLSLFRYARFKDVSFESCNLREADFQGADLRGVLFTGSDLRGANLSGAKLEKADFRGAQLEGVLAFPADWKGAIIDGGQALELSGYFAQLLGLTVTD